MKKHQMVSLAAMALALASASAAFPTEVEVFNNTFRTMVEPETSTLIEPYSPARVVVKDEAQFQRMLSNLEALNTMNGYVEDAGLSVHWPSYSPELAEVAGDAQGGDAAEAQRQAEEKAAADAAEAQRQAEEKAAADAAAAAAAAAASAPAPAPAPAPSTDAPAPSTDAPAPAPEAPPAPAPAPATAAKRK